MNATSHAVSKPLRNLPASFWLRRRQKRAASVLALGALFAGSLHPVSAAPTTYYYTGNGSNGSASTPITGNFSTGFNPPISINGLTSQTTTNDTLSFAGTTYNAIDDFTNTVNINAISFSNTGTVTIVRGPGNNTPSLITLGGTTPNITTGTGSVAINLDLLLTNNAMFNIGSGGLAINGVVSGSSYGFTGSGSGVLILSAANTYGGGTTINSGGTIQVGDGGASTSGTLGTGAVVNNGTLVFNRANAATTSNVISGTGSLLQNGSGTLTLSGANTYSGGTTISSGTTIKLNTVTAALGTGAVTDNGTLSLSANQLSVSNNISGAGSINLISLSGPYVITLSGNNTSFTGTVTTSANTLKLGSTQALGSSSNVTVSAGGTLDFNGFSPVSNVPLSLATGATSTSGTLTNSSGTVVSFGGAITVSGLGNLNVTGAGSINLSGAITSPNTINVAMSGTNALTLSGTSDNSAGLVARTGTVILGKASDAAHHSIGSNGLTIVNNNTIVQLAGTGNDQIADSALVTLTSGTFDLHGNSETIGSLGNSGATGGIVTNTAAGAPSILTIGGQNGSGGNFGGVISDGNGIAGVAKVGTGTQTVTGANTYTGQTTISGGTLQLGSGGSVGSLAASGAIVDNGNLTINRYSTVAQGTDFSGSAISGTGSLTQAGSGTTTLNIANTYTGGTIVTGGTLNASAANSLGTGALAVNNANVAAASNVIIRFTANQAVSSLSSAVSGTSGNTAQITIDAGHALTDTQSGMTNYAGSVSGSGTLNVGGQSSSAPATVNYTGTDSAAQTNVNAYATVQLANTSGAALSGPVAVATNGTLTINANATNNEIATTAPPSATPTTAAVTLNGGTLNASGSDGAVNTPTQLATTTIKSSMGALTLGAGGTKTTPSLLALAGGTTSSPIILAFADSSLTLGTGYLNITGYTGTTNALYIGTANTLSLTQLQQISFNGLMARQLANGQLVAAPEPSTLLSLLIGTAALGGLAWRRRRSAQQES